MTTPDVDEEATTSRSPAVASPSLLTRLKKMKFDPLCVLPRQWRKRMGIRVEPLPGEIRSVHINDAVGNMPEYFPSNYITTSKYNLLTFIPKNLYEQFRRLANFYFLMISALQLIPGLSPTGQYTTLLPLCLVLLATALKEAYEDFGRHREDAQVNGRKTHVYNTEHRRFEQIRWEKVSVGDVVLIRNRELIPADVILLATSDTKQGIAYVETSQLDGETNLKLRQCLEETRVCCPTTAMDEQHADTLEFAPEALNGAVIDCETPNNRIHTFEGSLKWNNTAYRLEPKQLLLRGCCLRNTKAAVGVVVFTGRDTKLMMNQRATPLKRSSVEVLVNKTIAFLFATEILLAVICTIGSAVWMNKYSKTMWYLGIDADEVSGKSALNLLTFIILFNNLIPISMYVSIEFVRLAQAFFINSDEDMHYRDTYALARTSNLNEELGQVHYIFSDKTGTLTQNIMQFRKCSIAGVIYGKGDSEIVRQARRNRGEATVVEDINTVADGSADSVGVHAIVEEHVNFDDERLWEIINNHSSIDPTVVNAVSEFMILMAVCHTVIPDFDPKDPTKMIYQCSSPDEGALVGAAKALGFEFVDRTPKTVTISVRSPDGGEGRQQLKYDVLHTIEFNGARKRMSVIVRSPEGRLILYCKGADTVIYQRLAPNQPYGDITIKHLENFASDGLRTLCLSCAILDTAEYEEWAEEYRAAENSIGNREAEVDRVAEKIEKNLFLLGATAIEDKLQDGVPETIKDLADANIKIWMLTGDKQETAVNIGFACQLLTSEMRMMVFNEATEHGTLDALDSKLMEMRGELPTDEVIPEGQEYALVIDSKTLDLALTSECAPKLVELAKQCKAVICCRCTPLQKARVVTLIRESLKNCVTLAIGDGANDVNMIQSAHVGVGISGEEGLQAARSSDYAIAQFRYLKKLLLIHGRYSYRRTSLLILYTFYRNFCLYMTQFWFTFVNGYSGQSLYDRWTLACYNVLFTFVPVVVFAIFDKDVSQATIYRMPRLFSQGQNREIYNYKNFWGWTTNALFHSFLLFIIPYAAMKHTTIWPSTGWSNDLYSFGHTIYTCVLITVSCKLFIESRYWTWVNHLVNWGSLLLYVLWVFIYGVFWWVHVGLGDTYLLLGVTCAMSPTFWLTILITPVLCLSRDVCWKFINRSYWPQPSHIAQELERDPHHWGTASIAPTSQQLSKVSPSTPLLQMEKEQQEQEMPQLLARLLPAEEHHTHAL